jgi:flavodoxin
MKFILVYDSLYGNTEKVARSIGDVLAGQGEVILTKVVDFKMDLLAGVDLFIVGSPTQQFKATAATKAFLKAIPANGLKGVRVAAFDTRLTQSNIDGTPVLPFFVKLFGYAAEPISKELQKKGGSLVISPEGFYVEGMEGPLMQGELERAGAWAKRLSAETG